jgi:hypothetical protein
MIRGVSRLRSWFQPPRTDDPVARLAWVSRNSRLAGMLAMISGGLQFALGRPLLGAILVAIGIFGLLSELSTRAAMKRAEERGPPSDEDRARGRRRARRFFLVFLPLWVVGSGAVGWLIAGAGLAIFLVIAMSVGFGFGIWLSRDQLMP